MGKGIPEREGKLHKMDQGVMEGGGGKLGEKVGGQN
jgi:hypothetical protein